MIYLGDYFALGLVIILCIFFFDSKTGLRFMPASSKLFVGCLITTALTAATDLYCAVLLESTEALLWQNMLANSIYFVVNILATTAIALYLFTRLLEHTHERRCMRYACTGLTLLIPSIWCLS